MVLLTTISIVVTDVGKDFFEVGNTNADEISPR